LSHLVNLAALSKLLSTAPKKLYLCDMVSFLGYSNRSLLYKKHKRPANHSVLLTGKYLIGFFFQTGDLTIQSENIEDESGHYGKGHGHHHIDTAIAAHAVSHFNRFVLCHCEQGKKQGRE